LILNPFEGLSSFGENAARPGNQSVPDERLAKEQAVSTAFMQYLVSSGVFAGFREEQAEWKILMKKDLIAVWTAFESHPEVAKLAAFTKLIFTIVVNQISSNIKLEHQTLRLTKMQGKRQVHKSTDTLLAVPRYSDLLDDQDHENESERGQLLVSSRQGWRTEMAKWITEATKIDAEAALMEALADADEDKRLDDGAVEIESNEEYHG
ncbi:hypothetical protein PILCRDRAFT_93951, partial [Piloderma croceum F 1598]